MSLLGRRGYSFALALHFKLLEGIVNSSRPSLDAGRQVGYYYIGHMSRIRLRLLESLLSSSSALNFGFR